MVELCENYENSVKWQRPSKVKGSVTDFCKNIDHNKQHQTKKLTQQCRLSATIGMKSPRPI